MPKKVFAQPSKSKPVLRVKDIKKGIYKERFFGNINFTDVGKAAWKTALSLDKNATIRPAMEKINPVEWDILLSAGDLWILLEAWYYKGFWDSAKNIVISIEFQGDDESVSKFVRKFVKMLGRNPWEIRDWESFKKNFNLTRLDVEAQWRYYLDYGKDKKAEKRA
jgi:hypothetical protein